MSRDPADLLRDATPGDAPAIAEIHNQSIAAGDATTEEGRRSVEDVVRQIADLRPREGILVLEQAGEALRQAGR